MKIYSIFNSRRGFKTVLIGGVSPWFFSFLLCFFTLSSALGAPYPPDGLEIKWVQPDGTPLTLRVFGDEFYGRTTTEDGYTVLFSTTENTYYYAERKANGKSLISSGVPADQLPPPGLSKHLKEPKDVVAAIHAANVQKYAPDREAKWKARKSAVRHQRALDAGEVQTVTAASGELSSAADLAAAAAPITGAKLGLMILVQFPDDQATGAIDPTNFPTTQTQMTNFANQVGYVGGGNTGSIRDYFYDQSGGRLTFTHSVTTIITLPHPRKYYNYSNYPTNPPILRNLGDTGRMLVTDAIAKLKASGFNFSTLTVDSTNKVIATSLLFAGNNSGVYAQGLWPHQGWVNDTNDGLQVGTTASPRYIYRYQISNVADAFPKMGTICHELGHLLLDYPDWSYGESAGVGDFSLMGTGFFRNDERTPAPIDMYLRDVSGWEAINDEPINSLPHTATINDLALGVAPTGYRIRKPGSSTEYFLIGTFGTANKWAQYLPDQGMSIWHVDEAVTTDNQLPQMTSAQHYELSLEQADGRFNMEKDGNFSRGDNGDLYDPLKPFSDSTLPNAKWWNGTASGIWIQATTPPGQYSQSVEFKRTVIQFSSAGYSVNEGKGTVILTVNRTGLTTTAVSVTYATSNGTATAGSDYTAKSGTLSFASGVTSATISIPITNDTDNEGDENFVVTLSSPSPVGAVLGSPSSKQVIILTDPSDIPSC